MPFIVLVLVQFAFASWHIIGKVLVEKATPLSILTVRVVGTAMLFVVLGALGHRRRPPLFSRELPNLTTFEWWKLSLVGFVLNPIFFTWGLKYIPAVYGTVLMSTTPLMTMALAMAKKQEKISLALMMGMLVALCGSLLLIENPSLMAMSQGYTSTGVAFGAALVVLSGICTGVFFVQLRSHVSGRPSFGVLRKTFVLAAVMVAPLGVFAVTKDAHRWDIHTWLALVFASIVATALPYAGDVWALTRVPSSIVAIFSYLKPLIAIGLSLLFGNMLASLLHVPTPNERLDTQTVIGAVAICVGVWMATRSFHAPEADEPLQPP